MPPGEAASVFDLVRRAETGGRRYAIAGDAAVTGWRLPGAWRRPISVMLRRAWPMLATFGTGLPRALRVQGLLEKHHPTVPHWYLEFAGSLPECQGRGFGGAAISARLRETDASGVPVALETANPANLAVYNANGFVVTGTVDVTPDLTFWMMGRDGPA